MLAQARSIDLQREIKRKILPHPKIVYLRMAMSVLIYQKKFVIDSGTSRHLIAKKDCIRTTMKTSSHSLYWLFGERHPAHG